MDNLDHHMTGHPRSEYDKWEKPIADGTLEAIVTCATGWSPLMRVGNDNDDHNELWSNPQDPHHSNNSIIVAPPAYINTNSSTMTDTCLHVLTCNNVVQSMDMKLSSSAEQLQRYEMELVHGGGQVMEISGNGGDEACVALSGSSTWLKGTTSGDIHQQREAESTKEEDKKNKKRSRRTKSAMTVHQDQSECRREDDDIHQRMKTLQNLVPNSTYKIDRVSILDEGIEYIKRLQTQVQNLQIMMMMMVRQTSVPYPMMHYPTIPQMQMSMMPQMGCHQHTLNASPTIGHPTTSLLLPRPSHNAYEYQRPISPYDHHPSHPVPQPMTVEAYNRIVAFYHQLNQSPPATFSTP